MYEPLAFQVRVHEALKGNAAVGEVQTSREMLLITESI
jgi:hypothetical protein